MNIHIETERFIMRDIEETDVEGIFLLDSDPEVHEFLGKKPITTLEEAESTVRRVRDQYKKNGIGRWALIEKATGEFMGWSGLKYEEHVRDFGYFDLGYRLQKKFWGRGIATESALESLKYGFTKMNLPEIAAAADVAHVVSNHILQKVGLKHIEVYHFEGEPCNWYKLTKEEWMLRNSGTRRSMIR